MAATREELFALLDELGIAHRTVEHPPAFTVGDARSLRGQIPGGHTKNLFLKDKKGRLWLVVAGEETAVNLKELHKRIGAARLSFGKAELMEEALGVAPGSVTPFALMNDGQGRVTVVLDERMMEHQTLNFHPLENTATTSIARDDLLRFLHATGHEPLIVNVE
ncbi:MAG TPA: prolyl-tRNA synthetase associated domain-containing protein [Thermopetrobacter sp.]|nr:prolyl-tRNA synthetase associated domain-containing protein [Thermopetrobacter sp.]